MGEKNKNLIKYFVFSFLFHFILLLIMLHIPVNKRIKKLPEIRQVMIAKPLKFYPPPPVKKNPLINKATKKKAIVVKPFKIKGGEGSPKVKKKNKVLQRLKSESPQKELVKKVKKEINKEQSLKTQTKKKYNFNLSNESLNSLFNEGVKKQAKNSGRDNMSELLPQGQTAGFEGSGKGDGIDAYGGTAYFDIEGYDITPWAKRAVYRIKKNWFPPLAASWGKRGKVTIMVVFLPNGKLAHLSIYKSSGIQSYDIAAMEAFRLSSPFPPLPNDFPNRFLKAYFVFIY